MPSATLLTSAYDEIDRTSYTTASVSPTANRWLVVDTWSRDDAGSIAAPTVSGLALSWTTEHSRTGGTGTHQISRFYAATGPSPGSGTISLSFGAASMDGCAWSVYELSSDVDVGDPFVQSVSIEQGSVGTSISVTLAAFADAANRPLISAVHRANEASTQEAGYTEISDVFGANPITGFAVAYHGSATDTTPSYSWATSASNPSFALASEIRAGAAGGVVLDPFGMSGFFGG